jgi:uncharacterized protein (TIGR02147 family)
MMLKDAITYQHFLFSEFEGRKSRNPGYSLRAFARDLGLAAPKLSEILRGKCGLSEASARRLVIKLGLTDNEAEVFINLVVLKHGRRSQEREAAKENLKKLKNAVDFNEISLESFKILADWYHFAILELTEIQDFKSDSAWIAKKLKITKDLAEKAITRLFDFGLLAQKKDGSWYQTKATLATPSGVPSTAIRSHHRQILNQASDALLDVPVAERDFSATTMAIASDQLEDVQKMIKKFRRELAAKLAKAPEKDRVYCLALQFFPFDRKGDSL